MESVYWVQQHLDDTLLFTYTSVTTTYVYTPRMMRFVPTPWMQYSVPTPQRMRPSNPSRRPYRYEVPPRMRSQPAANAMNPSPAVDASFNETALELQNPQILNERIERQDYISNFLLGCLGRSSATEENIICTICQDEINLEEEMTTLSCNHIYHVSCIKKWLLIKNECPVCRASVIPSDDDDDDDRDLH